MLFPTNSAALRRAELMGCDCCGGDACCGDDDTGLLVLLLTGSAISAAAVTGTSDRFDGCDSEDVNTGSICAMGGVGIPLKEW